MAPPHILIVGAGSMGVFLGHYLHFSGAQITFLVRPHRVESLSKPQVIYSYHTHKTQTFKDFGIISNLNDIAKASYDFVIVALDGHHVATADGLATLKSIGDAIRDKSTPVIAGSVGNNTVSHYAKATGLPEHRIIQSVLWTLVHEVAAANLPVHPPTDAKLLATSDYAFHLITDASLYILANKETDDIKRFVALYGASGVTKCDVSPPAQFLLNVDPSFAFLIGWGIQGWKPATELADDKATWKLTVDAVKELQVLEEFGELGKAAQAATTPEGFLTGHIGLAQAVLPLDYAAFNKYHHGGKVRVQDVEKLEGMVTQLELESKPTIALKTLISRFKALY